MGDLLQLAGGNEAVEVLLSQPSEVCKQTQLFQVMLEAESDGCLQAIRVVDMAGESVAMFFPSLGATFGDFKLSIGEQAGLLTESFSLVCGSAALQEDDGALLSDLLQRW